MSSTLLPVGPALGVAMAVLVVVAVAVSVAARLGHDRAVVTAALRAVVQLTGVALVLAAVVEVEPLVAAFLLVMLATATVTAGRRMTRDRSWRWAAVPVASGPLLVVTALLAVGVLPTTPLAVIAVAGILIGGAMTSAALAGRRALDELAARRGEVEAALSVGLLPRDAALEIGRPQAATALIPVLDQTRTVGLVVLPGAFVGMLIGGADPIQAGAVQLFVLVALLAIEAIAVALTIELVARGVIVRP
ncbi:ABC transporter permease [Jiangella mangrovi]|uniref:Putative ABC transport system permease protein n=1 Tax=Jiangella mangrovi TaxID=1524084 RepID=A0A7W9GQ34_9ACTN|nr:ABC transporter permease [Jiangella mangrovi]MBB5787748.1 putative ABC transport system permease protein [Jiangella mangrovi]